MSAQTIPAFGFTPNEFVLHNASPELVDLKWGGVMFTLPPVDVVGPKAAKDVDGDPIPGTLVLRDALVMDKEGTIPPVGSPANWLAFEAIRNLLGIDPVTKEARGAPAKAGLSFLPNSPSKDVIAAVRADGTRRYQEHRVEWAQYTVSAYESRVAACKMVGVPPPPPDQDYAKALIVLKRNEAKFKAEISEAGVSDDEEVAFMAFAKARAMEMAEAAAAGKNVDKAQLAEELLKDPKVRIHLQRKYSIRQRGYLEVPVAEPPQEA